LKDTSLSCSLCRINPLDDLVFYHDNLVTVCRTKDLKGHNERIMVILNRHDKNPSLEYINHARKHLIRVGRHKFLTSFFILHDTFSRVGDHWHLVASDLDPETEDYEQMLKTERELIR